MPTSRLVGEDEDENRNERRLLVESISREDAEVACSFASKEDFENCVYDVMVTNDLDMAKGVYGED